MNVNAPDVTDFFMHVLKVTVIKRLFQIKLFWF